MFPVRSRGGLVTTSNIQSSWSMARGDIVDVLAAVEDFLLAQAARGAGSTAMTGAR